MKQKDDLQSQKKAQEELATEKLQTLNRKAKSVGNYVHESVPVSSTEVRKFLSTMDIEHGG